MTATAYPTQKIESSSLYKESTSQKGDPSFAAHLQVALESLLGMTPLKFDFNFKASGIEQDFDNQTQQQKIQNYSEHKEQSENRAAADLGKKEIIINDLKTIKQALIQNIPLPIYAPPLMAQNALQTSTTGLSRSNLQIIIDQIIAQAKLIKSSSKVQLSLEINQEELGNLLIELTSKQGLVLIQIAASQELKKELDSNLEELKRALKDSHIKLGELKIVEVKEESHA